MTDIENNDQGGDIVTQSQYLTVLKCTVGLGFLLCLGGIFANVLNIRTFLRMGLDDSVTIVFFSLAISDLVILIAGLTHTTVMVCEILELDVGIYFELKPYYITVFVVVFGRTFSYITMLLTAFLAVQRCLCVSIPLHFKGMFTRSRTFVILMLIWSFALTWGGTHISQYEIKKFMIPGLNSSIFIMTVKPSWYDMAFFIKVVMGIIVNSTCQFIVLICVFIMAHALNKSVQFRQTASAVTQKDAQGQHDEKDEAKSKDKSSSAKIAGASSKEKIATVQVSIVSTIFLISNSPFLITSVAQLIVPELGPYLQYHNMFNVYYQIKLTIEMINSAANFLVYYKYNTKFKKLCFQKKS